MFNKVITKFLLCHTCELSKLSKSCGSCNFSFLYPVSIKFSLLIKDFFYCLFSGKLSIVTYLIGIIHYSKLLIVVDLLEVAVFTRKRKFLSHRFDLSSRSINKEYHRLILMLTNLLTVLSSNTSNRTIIF